MREEMKFSVDSTEIEKASCYTLEKTQGYIALYKDPGTTGSIIYVDFQSEAEVVRFRNLLVPALDKMQKRFAEKRRKVNDATS